MENSSFTLTPFQERFLQVVNDSQKDLSLLLHPEDNSPYQVNIYYLKMLLLEKHQIQASCPSNIAIQLIEKEICRIFFTPFGGTDMENSANLDTCLPELGITATDSDESVDTSDNEVTLSESVLIPVETYPSYNFIGRIIGPRGMTAKQLEKETGCRIMIRGHHSNKTYGYSQRVKTSLEIDDKDLTESPLRVVVETSGPSRDAKARMAEALHVINSLLVPPPDGRDELKRRQLVELAIMNGTYRATNATSPSKLSSSQSSEN